MEILWNFDKILFKATISRKRCTVWSLIVCHMGCCYVVVLGKKMSFPWGLDSECGALLTPLSSPLHNVFKWKSNPRIQICTYLIILSQIVFGNPENIFSVCTFCTTLAKGKLISKCLFGVIVWTKNQWNFFQDFCPSL